MLSISTSLNYKPHPAKAPLERLANAKINDRLATAVCIRRFTNVYAQGTNAAQIPGANAVTSLNHRVRRIIGAAHIIKQDLLDRRTGVIAVLKRI